MCGIAGYSLSTMKSTVFDLKTLSHLIAHRGPDDEGFVLIDRTRQEHFSYASSRSPSTTKHILQEYPLSDCSPHNIGMSHVRYSIIDLSTDGHQPMWSQCQSVCLTFNGEIYNYIELRQELSNKGYVFLTKTDTEVFLAGYLIWKEHVFKRINGFFAIALYDKKKNSVLLARDRIGKAHLYYVKKNNNYYWSSEIKSLLGINIISRDAIRQEAIQNFVIHGQRDTNGTFWQGIYDFPPAHYSWIQHDKPFQPIRYWQLPEQRQTPNEIGRQEASEELRHLLQNALTLRMRADVKVGFELSGGLDSSSLVGIACGMIGQTIDAYTIKFNDPSANEEGYAKQVAQHYSKQLNYHVVEPQNTDFWEEANYFVDLQEEPFHSPNLHTNQTLRRHLKKQGIHVVITGAGSDELLAGYANEYQGVYLKYLLKNQKYQAFYQALMHSNESTMTSGLKKLVMSQFNDNTINQLTTLLSPARNILRNTTSATRFPMAGNTFNQRVMANMTYRMMNYWLRSSSKSDYGIPIETRSPFLDYHIIECCMRLPPEYLIHQGWQKHILRLAVEPLLPSSIAWRKIKMGFPFPYKTWLTQNKIILIEKTKDIDCQFIDIKSLYSRYDTLVKDAPVLLWRIFSTLLWWKKVIEQRQL